MATIKDICKKIPDEVRAQRLLTKEDPINKAQISLDDANMAMLVEIWKTFIEPHKEIGTCPICLDNIRTNFRQMHETLIELEEDHQKLSML
jgi:hypothetical protein